MLPLNPQISSPYIGILYTYTLYTPSCNYVISQWTSPNLVLLPSDTYFVPFSRLFTQIENKRHWIGLPIKLTGYFPASGFLAHTDFPFHTIIAGIDDDGNDDDGKKIGCQAAATAGMATTAMTTVWYGNRSKSSRTFRVFEVGEHLTRNIFLISSKLRHISNIT